MAADLVGLGQIGVRLIEKISDATGVIYEPTRIARRANAEAKAAIIQAETDVEVAAIRARAAERFVNEQILHQANMEAIIEKASSRIEEDASPEDMADDWLLNFFDKSRMVSDDEMQEIWAHILADEANFPGAYSRRAVNILSELDKSDAELFNSLCRFRLITVRHLSITAPGLPPYPRSRFNTPSNPPCLAVMDLRNSIYSDHGIDYDALLHLEGLGLITTIPQGYSSVSSGKVPYVCENRHLILSSSGPIPVGMAKFTSAGAQLSELCFPLETPTGFADYLTGVWESQGIDVSNDLNDVIEMTVEAYTIDPETGERTPLS